MAAGAATGLAGYPKLKKSFLSSMAFVLSLASDWNQDSDLERHARQCSGDPLWQIWDQSLSIRRIGR